MEITFTTKEESNKIQQDNFLQLSKIERIYAFLRLSERINKFPAKIIKKKTNNFIILIPE